VRSEQRARTPHVQLRRRSEIARSEIARSEIARRNVHAAPLNPATPAAHPPARVAGWTNESAAVLPWEPQPNGFCDHSPIGGATEEDFHCTQDMGLVQADTTAIRDAWQANMRAVQEAVIKNGGFAWAYFLQRTTPSNTSTPSQCAAFFRTACAPNASEFTSALFLEYTQPGTYPLVAFEHDLATFLLIRGPFAWMGYAWVGCAVTYDFPAALHLDYGQPSSGQCAETAPGSGVFSRAWSHADVSFDCNTWTPTIAMR